MYKYYVFPLHSIKLLVVVVVLALISAVSADTPERNIWISKPLMPSSGITPWINIYSPRPLAFVILRFHCICSVWIIMRNFSKTVIRYSVDCILKWTSNSSHLYHKQQKQPIFSKLWLVKMNYICTAPLKSKLTVLTWNMRLDSHVSKLERIKFQVSRNQHFWVFMTQKDFKKKIYFSRNIKNSHLHYSENSHQPSALNMYKDDRTNGCLSLITDNRVFVFL